MVSGLMLSRMISHLSAIRELLYCCLVIDYSIFADFHLSYG